jgi:hypothetical protein
MKYLFNNSGNHIANEVNGQLYSPSGNNIGHFIANYGIIIDMQGNYLGEIILENRLMYNLHSPHRNTNFGNYGNFGNVGNYGNPGNYGSIGQFPGYKKVKI